MCKSWAKYSINQFAVLRPFQYSKHFVTHFVGFSILKLGKMIMENVFKIIHWKCVKQESQLIIQLIKLQF